MSAFDSSTRFEAGARALAAVERRLVRVALPLDQSISGALPVLPHLPRHAQGYAISSLAECRRERVTLNAAPMIAFVRRRHNRYHIDLSIGLDAYLSRVSDSVRAGLHRRARRIAEVSGGAIDIRRYSGPAELIEFYDIARWIADRSARERVLGTGLPDDEHFVIDMTARAAAGQVRGWLLYVSGEPAAYLYAAAEGDTLRYTYAGHDPAFTDLAPGGVLTMTAIGELFESGGFARFDFGDGRHAQQLATGGVPCIDLMLLRPSLVDRMTKAAITGATGLGRRVARVPALNGLAKKALRAS